MTRLTHLDDDGAARMVDVTDKPDTVREAVATGRIVMAPHALALVREGSAKKGDVLAVARVAAIMAAKRTADLIPLCHHISLSSVAVEFTLHADAVAVVTRARTTGPTGVEMEALVAASTALLTIYDMVKAVDRGMRIDAVQLLEKSGGQSGRWVKET